jgi:hypothetical protein
VIGHHGDVLRLRSVVLVAALVAGLVSGAVAFRALSAGDPVPDPHVVAHSLAAHSPEAPPVTVPRILPGTRFVWAACEPPAVLKHHACVTRVVRTVTVPGTG